MENTQKLTERESSAINLMKALAVLSVIAAHVVSFNDSSLFSKVVTSFWAVFGEVGVIIFFVIGGFLYKRKTGDNKEFWKKRSLRILLPWFFCSAITYALQAVVSSEWGVVSYIKWVLGSGTWYYYITVYTAFIFVFKSFYKKDVALYIFMGIQLFVLTLQSFGVIITYPLGFFTDYLNPFHWAGYFSLGILIRKYRIDVILRERKTALFVAGVISVASLFFLCYKEIFTYFHIISLVFCVSALIPLAAISYAIAKLNAAKKIGKIGTYSYCIYLLHMQIVQGVCSKIPDGVLKSLFSPFIGLAIMLIIILCGLFICNRLPFGDKIKTIVGL